MTARLIQELSGHSGCRLLLLQDERGPFVRKISPSAAYDDRLRRQKEKQEQLRDLGFACPEALGESVVGGRYAFDMAFLAGAHLGAAIEDADRAALDRLAEALGALLDRFGESARGALDPALFIAKLAEIAEGGGEVRAAAEALERRDWTGVPGGLAHGDLTLENLLQRRSGALAMIDCLDGPLSSAWLDLAKLHQDLTAGWFLRDRPGRTGVRLSARHLARRLEEALGPRWREAHARLPDLLAFQLLRIAPYARDARTLRFVLDRVRDLQPETAR